ncbi:MAG: glycosyltransferase [Cyclobacteriaceae bacterium]
MAKYLIVVPPYHGHISPTLAIGAGLVQNGHTVHWFSPKAFPAIDIPDTSVFFVPESLDGSEEVERCCTTLKTQYYSVFKSMKILTETAMIPLSRVMMQPLESYVQAFQPDVIINDHLSFAASIIAYKKGIPYATSWSAPSGIPNEQGLPPKIYGWLKSTYVNHQKEYGIDVDRIVVFSETMNIVATSPEFMRVTLPPPFHQVGPLIKGRKQQTDFDWDRLHASDQPKVMISIGTVLTNFQKDFYQVVIEAVADLPVTFVAVAEPGILDKWPDNFIVQSYVPQLELLPHMNALIGHGGHNTTCEALYFGLPLIIVPIVNDAYEVAEQVEAIGCGLRANFYRLKADKLRAMLLDILENPSYKQKSEAIQNSFIAAGGVPRAISLLESLIKPSEDVLYF